MNVKKCQLLNENAEVLKLKFKKICLPSCWGLRSFHTAIMIASTLKNSGYAT